MTVIIEIYIFICAMLLLFDIGFLLLKSFKNRRFHMEESKMKSMIEKELKGFNPAYGLSQKLQKFLKTDVEKTKNLIVFHNVFEKITDNKALIQIQVRPYILSKLDLYKKKSDYEQAYYAYVVSTYNYGQVKWDDNFTSSFLSFLESKSLYVFFNTMNAICNFSDPYLVFAAIQKVDERNRFYNSKLFVDGLLRFKGDETLLQSLIMGNFENYSPLTQESLVSYFRIKNAPVEEFCLKLLMERNLDKEVRYATMRYFAKKSNKTVKELFLKILQENNQFWVDELLAIQGLKQYDDLLVKNAITSKITSKNWHVRTNAISYLQNHAMSQEEITKVLRLNDKYTNESLLYYYKNDEVMSSYIIETSKLINEENTQYEELEVRLAHAILG